MDKFWRRFHNVIKLNIQCSFDVFLSFPKEEDMEDVTLQLTTDNFCAEKLTNWALGSGELKSKHILYSIKCEPTWYYHWQRKNNTIQESHSKLITFEYFRLYFKNKDWYKHPYIIKQFLNKKYRYALCELKSINRKFCYSQYPLNWFFSRQHSCHVDCVDKVFNYGPH